MVGVIQLALPLVLLLILLGLVLLNHYMWFNHFSSVQYGAAKSIYDAQPGPSFTEIASYFGLCVWLVPFSLFVSLSAGDNVLPTIGSEEPSGASDGKNKRQGMIKVVVDTFRDWIGNLGKLTGWWRRDPGLDF